ncbi:DNA polymerase III subunit chi [Aquipseudomonas campi]|uniref:DNA polymerase III subunit chi n=1 Tax=Aquipseudomonas campi TaxID=2731681 RepID=A0A6M8FDS0_9GAMM|nr:DNA polymerase III subunit chi [Pseudomonas campi]QKE62312.1 DNA polymerase III subunit chi [Pseudomonas campi]
MDTPKPPKPDHLLDDLESIRKLLEEQQLEPPLLTDSLDDDLQIPLLSDIIEPGPTVSLPTPPPSAAPVQPASATSAPAPSLPSQRPASPVTPSPAATPVAPAKPATAPSAPARSTISSAIQRSVSAQGLGELNRLDGELRAAAQLLLQDVIDDFVPQIEAELKRRLDARLDRLLAQRKP